MACFLVPTAEAIVTTIASKVVEKKEDSHEVAKDHSEKAETAHAHVPFSRKLGWLNKMLWGGSALLAFEHVWHGEVVPYFPFLTAASDPADAAEMLHEMSTVGVTMALLVTTVWFGIVAVTGMIEKRFANESSAEEDTEV
ncbi:MAG: hypothetical protein K5871_01010 [Lachnospiraceae bacterium]|nr:hypothetical protein [Lachnospiraceae bacterium]